MKNKRRKNIKFLQFLLVAALFICAFNKNIFSQSTGDYRTRATGNWNATTVWQRYNGTTWANITTYPTSTDGVISIRNGHTITFNMATIDVDQMVIDAGGTLTFASSPAELFFNILDGPGVDLINNGTLIVKDYGSSDSRLVIYGQAINNSQITIEVDCHIHLYGSLQNNATITTNHEGNYDGKFFAYSGSLLQCSPTSRITGGGDFELNKGATIEVGSPQGINALGNTTGNITTTHIRYFSDEATYVYNGVANQNTGTAFSKADGVIISNESGVVTFSNAITMSYLKIISDAKVNLANYTHNADYLMLPIGSFSLDDWGSTQSTALNKNDVYFSTAGRGRVVLNNRITLTYTVSDTFYTCATDTAYYAIVEAWGAGGKGGSRTTTTAGAGGGGGGGAYSKDSVLIIPGQTYIITVGEGATTTNPGGDSWFGPTSNPNQSYVLAKGGASVGNNVATGANGGAANQGRGAVRYSGGKGATGALKSPSASYNYGGGGGSSAGVAANGNSPPANQGSPYPSPSSIGAVAPVGGGNGGNGKYGNEGGNGPGSPGKSPGGGGGGALIPTNGGIAVNGGNGGDGLVKITQKPHFPNVKMIDTLIEVCYGTILDSIVYTTSKGCPVAYAIDYGTAAINVGFKDVDFVALQNNSIPIIIPDTVMFPINSGH